jgi:DNA-binding MarR family transcriptional regulator
MALDSKSGNTLLKLWLLLHRVRDELVVCEDSVFGEYGLTTEKFSLLAAVKSRGGSLQPVELAEILARSPNSVSMLVDRMVKAGWVRRTRDRKDRRGVNVSLTSKGEKQPDRQLRRAGNSSRKSYHHYQTRTDKPLLVCLR